MRILGVFQVLFMVGGPLALTAYLRARWRLSWSMWGAGALCFVASQLVHVPVVSVLEPYLPKDDVATRCGILGLCAGLFEEPSRYLLYKYWLKKAGTFREGVFVGIGHGGVESILIGLSVGYWMLRSLSVTADAPAAMRVIAAMALDAAPSDRLFASIERVFLMTFHASMSLVVLAAVRRHRTALLGLAVFLHALVDAASTWARARHGFLGAEIVGLFAASLGAFIIVYAFGVDKREREAARGVTDHAGEQPASDKAISARALTKEFADRTAVNALTVDVEPGHVFAMLGPNGAGKTTTVRMLCALIPPTRGTARVAGSLLVSEEERLREHVGILTETPGLYERLTAYENLELFGRLYGLDPKTRAERIEKHLRSFDMWERRDDAVSGFSKGMKQKIAIVRSLIHEPDVLFLDEPTSGLDPIASREVHDMIIALKKLGRTILLTTHRLTEAEELADLVGIFKSKLLALDTVANLKSGVFGKQLQARVANPSEKLLAATRAVAGFETAAFDENKPDLMTLSVEDPIRQAPLLVRTLVTAGADIISVGEAKHSLEELYLELVQGHGSDGSGNGSSEAKENEKRG